VDPPVAPRRTATGLRGSGVQATGERRGCNNVGNQGMSDAKLTSGRAPRSGCETQPYSQPRVSVIVPLYNEQESIRPLYAAIVQAMGELGCSFEMVFVDDGGSDETAAIGAQIARFDARLRVVKFRRNYGQTPAMAAGIEHARGEVLVTMDGDLQNDPR